MVLIRQLPAGVSAGIINETEAYQGEEDLGCHAKAGRTPRTDIMYGQPGHAYVYFTYGMHWMLNVVTDKVGVPAAVLIRSIIPIVGLDLMETYRPRPSRWSLSNPAKGWTDGPAKLCRTLHIDGELNKKNLCSTLNGLWIVDSGVRLGKKQITVGPRVGLFSVPEPWKSAPWRWRINPETMDVPFIEFMDRIF